MKVFLVLVALLLTSGIADAKEKKVPIAVYVFTAPAPPTPTGLVDPQAVAADVDDAKARASAAATVIKTLRGQDGIAVIDARDRADVVLEITGWGVYETGAAKQVIVWIDANRAELLKRRAGVSPPGPAPK